MVVRTHEQRVPLTTCLACIFSWTSVKECLMMPPRREVTRPISSFSRSGIRKLGGAIWCVDLGGSYHETQDANSCSINTIQTGKKDINSGRRHETFSLWEDQWLLGQAALVIPVRAGRDGTWLPHQSQQMTHAGRSPDTPCRKGTGNLLKMGFSATVKKKFKRVDLLSVKV